MTEAANGIDDIVSSMRLGPLGEIVAGANITAIEIND